MLLVVYSSLITGSTYAYLYLENNSNGISGSGKCEGVNYKGENISASNLVSTTNYLEGAKSTITLSKNKDCTIYTYVNLYLYTNNTTTAPITTVKALKYKIVSSNNVTYSGVVSYMGDTLLATLPLEDKEVTYTIYLYIDSTLSLGNYNDKTYSGYIYATTEQTSTVGKEEDNTKKNLGLQTIDFDYLGSEQQFIVPQTGTSQLETWGAQGGVASRHNASFGGYSYGVLKLKKGDKVYVIVGGSGTFEAITDKDHNLVDCVYTNDGGYNGGGKGTKGCNGSFIAGGGGGGGATHMAFVRGTLESIGEDYLDKVLIVSGGGGGSSYNSYNEEGKVNLLGGSGGGFSGGLQPANTGSYYNKKGIFANQTSGYRFGLGADAIMDQTNGGGGGGLYGGYADDVLDGAGWIPGTGGSGYIGNSQLTNKAMYCYNCEESTEESTKTISTTNVSETPISKYAKKGNGYARITIIN